MVPEASAAPRLAAYAIDNERHLGRWEPPRPEGYFTDLYWERRIERSLYERDHDLSLRLAIFRRGDSDHGPVLGQVNFSNFIRGGFQACTLGYSVDRRSEGKGILTEALRAALPFLFEELSFHRVMANYIPTNERSGRLLRRLGFVVEGYARDYLFIGGSYQDHVLTALTNPNPVPPKR